MSERVFIIGAPRSGTNILRDVLTSVKVIVTWPCDEINYIWRHGNLRVGSDELLPRHASADVKKYIRAKFIQLGRNYPEHKVILEKTCANSLRVGFINEIFPESKFIFIHRNGYDVTSSARRRWTAPLDLPYVMQKVRYVPPTDIPFHAFQYFRSRIYKIFSDDNALKTWGPSFKGMKSAKPETTIDEICAMQWEACVRRSVEQLNQVDSRRICKISYEEFVNNPEATVREILNFLSLDVGDTELNHAVGSVHANSIGKGDTVFGEIELERLSPIVDPVNALIKSQLM